MMMYRALNIDGIWEFCRILLRSASVQYLYHYLLDKNLIPPF